MSRKSDAPARNRLAESAYLSPYSFSGAPTPHPTIDPYASLRARALATLEAMGYDPATMTERGVVWAEDQDPFGHVMQSQYMHYFGNTFHRIMESYSLYLSEQEYEDMIHARSVIPVVQKYELSLRRQVKYPDSLIAAHFEESIEPSRNNGIVSLFSLNQQAIVAEVRGNVVFMNAKTGRPADIKALGGGWTKVFEAFTKEAERANALRVKWNEKNPKRRAKATKL